MSAAATQAQKMTAQLNWLQSEVVREARRNNLDLTPAALEAILRPVLQNLPARKPPQVVKPSNKKHKSQNSPDLFECFMTAHLLPILKMGSAGKGPNGQLLPAYINPIITAFRLVLGEHLISQSSGYILQLENRYRNEKNAGNRAQYYRSLSSDPHSKALFAEYTLRFILAFERYSRRKKWFIRVINSYNANKTFGEPNPQYVPDFTVVHFTHFMTALALESKNSAKPRHVLGRMLLRRFSATHLCQFKTIFQAIQRDYAETTLYSFH